MRSFWSRRQWKDIITVCMREVTMFIWVMRITGKNGFLRQKQSKNIRYIWEREWQQLLRREWQIPSGMKRLRSFCRTVLQMIKCLMIWQIQCLIHHLHWWQSSMKRHVPSFRIILKISWRTAALPALLWIWRQTGIPIRHWSWSLMYFPMDSLYWSHWFP